MGLEYWRASRPGPALCSRQPTRCTNFCGADTLPRNSLPCCDIAPQRSAGCSEGFSGCLSSGKDRSGICLAGFAGQGFVANIRVATTHDGCPLLRRGHNAQARGKLHECSTESAGPRTSVHPGPPSSETAATPEPLRTRCLARTRRARRTSHRQMPGDVGCEPSAA